MMPESTSSFASIITWIIAAGGWFVVNNQNNSRETRKEINNKIYGLIKSIEDIEEGAIKFHTADIFDEYTTNKILGDIYRASQKVNALNGIGFSINTQAMISLKKAITLNNFDASSFKKQNMNSTIIYEIEDSTNNVISILENAYINTFNASPKHNPLAKCINLCCKCIEWIKEQHSKLQNKMQ